MHHNRQIEEPKAENFVSIVCIASDYIDGYITSSPWGSCIAYDTTTKTGGHVNVLLPGKSPKGNDNKYADNAIINLIDDFKNMCAKQTNLEICFVGGANVLRKENDNIANHITTSILRLL